MADSPIDKRQEELEKKLLEIQVSAEDAKYKNLADSLGLPYSDLKTVPIDNEALSTVSEEEAHKAGVAVIYRKDHKLVVATADPSNPEAVALIDKLKEDHEVSIIITNPRSLQYVLGKYQNIKKAEIFEIGAIDIHESELNRLEKEINSIADIKGLVKKVTTTGLLEIIMAGALKIGASDVHFEPESKVIRLRYRMDGILNDVMELDPRVYEKALNRIKVLSKMKLNVHNAPQDGRFTIRQADLSIEVRVSVLPSEYGETIVMRLLDPRAIKQSIEELGIRDDLLAEVKEVVKKPTGAIFTTGPTGSGKTTLLYALINHINSSDTKIITIEDPIEYHVDGISQTQVDARKGYTFASGLRAIVRQDPDVILVGEIRDNETADIALQAALTGHLVLSTIHTNDSAGTIPRLIDLGIQPQTIAPALNMAVAQRLVRKLCPKCRVEEKIKPEHLAKVKETMAPVAKRLNLPELGPDTKVAYPKGCDACHGTGYKGRIGVFEAFRMTKEMEKLTMTTPAVSDVRELAVKQGMVTMLQDAYLKLLNKVTTFEEIERVIG